jgi:hypothetical protein
MLQEDASRLRQGSGPQVMVGVRNLMIDECFFSGKTSLAAGNHHGHVPPRESGGTRVNLNRRMKRARADGHKTYRLLHPQGNL